MDGRYEEFFAQQEALILQCEKQAEARRRYLIDEAAYLFSEKFTVAGERLVFPSQSSFVDLFARLDRAARARFVCRLCEYLQTGAKRADASDFLLPEERASEGEHIVYVRNFYTERAYEIFAKKMNAPTVSYASDFTDACAEVGEGLGDLCILPFRDERWGAFHSFSRMPEDYALRVRSVCTVARTDGEAMRLSLCGRGCRIPQKAKELALELLFSSRNDEEFEDFRDLASVLGCQTVFAEALPDRYTARTSWRVTYRLAPSALAALLLGRRLLAPESELLGLYEMPMLLGKEP